MQIQTFCFNPFNECTYIVSAPNKECVIIDCGAALRHEQQAIADYIAQNQLIPTLFLLTHAHLDHCFGCKFIYETYNLLPHLNPKDDLLYKNLENQLMMFGLASKYKFLANYLPISETEIFHVGDISISNIFTPGHTEGGTCYLFKQTSDADTLFSGDTLFAGGYGRTDLPGGNYQELTKSLKKLMLLPDQTIVYPGHGMSTTIKRERYLEAY